MCFSEQRPAASHKRPESNWVRLGGSPKACAPRGNCEFVLASLLDSAKIFVQPSEDSLN
jgi:hypothetical protein